MKIWFDIANPPQVHFLNPIARHLAEQNQIFFTLREFAETVKLFELIIGKPYTLIGGHAGKSRTLKALGSIKRLATLSKVIPEFDIRINIGGDFTNYLVKLRNKKSIIFSDNELAALNLFSRITDYSFWPASIPLDILLRSGFHKEKIYQYDGFKEDIYIADFIPNIDFPNSLPFKEYVILRPENLMANYVDSKSTITKSILAKLLAKGFNVVYLARYEEDKNLVDDLTSPQLFIPVEPINGLDAVYFASAVLTGAGTLSREAACMGVPAVSFFAGSKLLSVDSALIKQQKIFFSRSPDEILEYISQTGRKREINIARSQEVKKDLLLHLDRVITNL